MTFANEEIRTQFHSLPTQTQSEWVSLDDSLARSGRQLCICEVHILNEWNNLEVVVHIREKFDVSSSSALLKDLNPLILNEPGD